jgi:hypothetical protein
MSNFNFDDWLRRRPIGVAPTGVNGVFILDAARPGARGRAVR